MSGRKPFALYRCVEQDKTFYLSVWAALFAIRQGLDEHCAASNICRAVRQGKKYQGLTFKRVKAKR
jgi:hypothetical protein